MQFLQAVENSSVGLRDLIFFGTQGSPVVRLKRDDINRQILAQALAFRGMELMLNTVFLCARHISLVLIGLLGGLLSTISSIASMISKSNASHLLIPDIAIPWLRELSAGEINSHVGGISVIDSWTPDARKLYKKTRQNRQKGKEFS